MTANIMTTSKTKTLFTAVVLVLATPAFAQDRAASGPSSGPQATSKSASEPTSGSHSMTVLTPMMVLVPTKVTVDNVTKNGCWARLYDQKNFQGDSFTLSGPIDLAEMKGPFGFNWENKVRSIETGPKTAVTIYDNRNFRDQNKKLATGAKVPDVSKQMGLFDDFRSMKMTCTS